MNYFEMANRQYMDRNYETAISLYAKAASLMEDQSSCLYNSAVCNIKLNRFNDAILLLKHALDKKKDSKYYFNLGYCLNMLGNFKAALIYFNRAWSLDNEDDDCKKAVDFMLFKLQQKK